MSRPIDYSKFDNLKEDSDDESLSNNDDNSAVPENQNKTENKKISGIIRRDEVSGRYKFEYNGRTVYEFEQSLDDVTIYIRPPPHVTKGRQINCIILANHFKLGLVGHGSWFLNEATYGTVDVDESTWTLEDYDGDDGSSSKNTGSNRRKIIVITLVKANRGMVWEAALRGNVNTTSSTNKSNSIGTKIMPTTMDPMSKEQVKKDLMLERFQEENPGFDFRGADFNGSVPDARDFMGGVKYQ